MTQHSEATAEGSSRPSRRDILRRSALVGGTLVWAAPTVQALAVPAYAGSDPTPGEFQPVPCKFKIAFKWTPPKDGASAAFEPNYTNDAGNCEPLDPNPTTPRAVLALQNANASNTQADLYAGGVYIGQLLISTTTPSSAGCWLFNFNLLPCYTVSESSSYYVVKDGNDTRVPGGANDCEAEDRGYLSTDDPDVTDLSYTPVNAATDEYRFCGEVNADGTAANGGGLSHVGLVLCIDQVAECA